MEPQTTATPQCIGRFQFALPAAFTLTNRSQSIYDVELSTEPLSAGGLGTVWASRIANIERLRPPSGAQQAIIRRFDLAPGAPAVWYFSNPGRAALVALEAGKAVGDHAVIANRSADLDDAELAALLKGGDPIVEQLVRLVLNDYTPSTKRGFCIGPGAIVNNEPGLREDVRIGFRHPANRDLTLRLQTKVVARPDTQTYSNLEEEKRTSDPSIKINPLREQNRVVAGLTGKEMRVAVAAPKQAPIVRFTWHFDGVAQKADQPTINVVGFAAERDQALLESAWETLLGSLRLIPF